MKQICLMSNCDKPRLARGFCNNHYAKLRRKGFSTSIEEWKLLKKQSYIPEPKEKCIINNCTKLSRYVNLKYCEAHYAKYRKYGDPLKIIQEQNHNRNPICIVKECKRKHYGLGYCQNHYMRLNRRSNNKSDLFLAVAQYNVRKKYNNKCQWYNCNKTPLHTEIHVHHIFPVSEYPELKYLEGYMITYCKNHHAYWHQMRGDHYYNWIRLSNGVLN